jgi:5-(carboxyamino)imidazole ribonucleotide synthase
MAQDRRRERRWVENHGLAGPAWAQVHDLDELDEALRTIGIPSVLKRAQGGYDGRGQCFIDPGTDARAAWASLGEVPCVLEERIDFVAELSVIAARDLGGRLAFYGPITNVHDHGILDHSVFPSHVPINVATEAREMARTIVEGLDVVGVVGIEMFLDTNGRLLINELAPRPHNSGHLTIETHATCQFEQHARAVLGLPLGSARALHPASTMVNLLGDLWSSGEPNWPVALSDDSTRVHLYGKKPKPRRKVGHMTVVAETSDLAREHALRLRQQLPAPATDTERKVKEVLAREAEVA